MKKLLSTLVILSLACIGFSQNITESNNQFALNLFHTLANSSSNTFFSPYSISTALFMTTGGARNQTETQMLEVLCQSENTDAYHKKFGEHIARLEKKENIQLNIANSIWMQKGYKFYPSFIDLLNNAYQAKLYESNFSANPDGEAKKINKWVEGKTKDKIKDLIKPGILKSNTKMVLVNAIYFYGGWKKEFDKKETREADFFLNNGNSIKTKFMNAEYKMAYAENNNFSVVSIPYENNEASMLIFLPKEKGNFEENINRFNYKEYFSLINNLNSSTVNLTFPKFKMTSEFELSKTLADMGMPLAFTNNADFSGMSEQNDLKIDKVIHKAFVDVSEKGTEAAAATAVIMNAKSAFINKDKTIYFKADHPFIFMIIDNASGQILFVGLLNNPEK
jgi:serpin B